MAALIVRIIGILIAAVGGLELAVSVQASRGIERLLFAALILLLGLALVLISILAPRFRERTDTIENCLGYRLKVDTSGEIIITCPRDTVEARLHRGELSFDEYAELVAPHEYGIRGHSRRAELAREHNDTTLLSSEYADELEALAGEISALRDSYAAGEIGDAEFVEKMDALR